jgi:hypothetical protein
VAESHPFAAREWVGRDELVDQTRVIGDRGGDSPEFGAWPGLGEPRGSLATGPRPGWGPSVQSMGGDERDPSPAATAMVRALEEEVSDLSAAPLVWPVATPHRVP